VKLVKAKRVAIDAFGMLFNRFYDKKIIRETIFRICDELKSIGVTSMITSEKQDGETNRLSRFGVEKFVADGVFKFRRNFRDNRLSVGFQFWRCESTITGFDGYQYYANELHPGWHNTFTLC
jgi:KaiC/GvpD/RAD55 family RecA-like ATPase